MRTKVHEHTHTWHDAAQEEYDRLLLEEKHLTRLQARDGNEQPKRRMSEAAVDVEAELAEVRAGMAEARKVIDSGKVRIVFKGLTRGEFRRLLLAHPPREGDEIDRAIGYNGDTFLDAYVAAAIVATTDMDGEPVPNEWQKWADDATKGQWEKMLDLVKRLTDDGEPVFPR